MDFFEISKEFRIKFNDIERIRKQLTVFKEFSAMFHQVKLRSSSQQPFNNVNKALIRQKIEKITKIQDFFQKFPAISDEFNGIGAIRKQLQQLITR